MTGTLYPKPFRGAACPRASVAISIRTAKSVCPTHPPLRDEMWRYQANELAQRDDLGLLPKLRKMPRVSSQEIIRAGSVSAFKEYVVAWVTRNLKASLRNNPMGAFPNEL